MSSQPRVGLVHERFTDIAGSEQVVEQLARIWPTGPVFVPFCRESGIPDIDRSRLRSSFLQPVYSAGQKLSYAPLLPAVPRALQHTIASEVADAPLDALVISHHAFAVGAARPDIPSLAYVHSPARWAWDATFLRGETDSPLGQKALQVLGHRARSNELRHVPALREIVANSSAVRDRIRLWWGKDARVIHPPVNVDYFAPANDATPRGDYFIVVGRMVPYKRVDIAVRAAIAAKTRLVVIGEGRDLPRISALAATAPDIVELKGFVPTEEVRSLVQGARALLMPGEEDFGIVPVEAMAAGTPVIALGKGGALDSVVDGETGVHVAQGINDDETVANFAAVMRAFRDDAFPRGRLIAHAAAFSPAEFRRKMSEAVNAML